jgi:transcriptional regulator with XRE-family HTH domain
MKSSIKTISINIKKLRELKAWSQDDLSEHTGLHRTYISGIENQKRNPTVAVLDLISTALSVQTYELLQPNSITDSDK